jgi:hypothetical protein
LLLLFVNLWSEIRLATNMAAQLSPSSSIDDATSTSGSSSSIGYIEHTVSKLDTLAGVVIKYGVKVADIKHLIALTTDFHMYALKTLWIPLQGKHIRAIFSQGNEGLHCECDIQSNVAPEFHSSRYAPTNARDIVIRSINGYFQRVSPLHSAYAPLHYVLLFSDGRNGWHDSIPDGFQWDGFGFIQDDENAIGGRRGSARVTMLQFYTYILQHRVNEKWILRAGRLLQQFIADAYACTEQNRLKFIRENQ